MSLAKRIEVRLGDFLPGELIRYDDLGINQEEYGAAAQAMGRMVKTGKIKRLQPGKFYKPRVSVFGELGPKRESLLKDVLYEN